MTIRNLRVLLSGCCLLSCCVLFTRVASAQDGKGNLLFFSVGVEPSLSAKGKNDPYARDAEHIASAFAGAESLYRRVSGKVVNGTGATHEAVVNGLHELARGLGPNDTGIVFFSTHGSWTEADGYTISLAQAGRKHVGLKGKEMLQILSQSQGRVIVFLDTCCAAGVLPPRVNVLPNVSFLVACQREEGSSGSGPSKVKPHGCFVVAMVEALKGKGDANQDGTVTLGEVQGYVPGRAKEMYNEQNAAARIRAAHANLPLAKVDPSVKVVATEKEPGTRNPFGMPDVDRPLGKEVMEFARVTRLPAGDDDPNAAAWASITIPKKDAIDGRWSSRWNSGEGEWATGTALIKIAEDRVFIMYHDAGTRYLIEARRNGQRLVGRYVNLTDENDSTPWVGRIIDNNRIDGIWPGGRWDLRRNWKE